MTDAKNKPLFDEPLEFGSIVFKEAELPEGVLARAQSVNYGKVTYVDLTDGEFFKYRPKAKD